MSTELQNRLRPGVPAGGQFAARARPEGSVSLGSGPIPYPVGSRVRVGAQFGRIAVEPDRNDNMVITFDDGWTLRTKSRDVVPWDAYLASEMPAVEYNPYGDIDVIDQEATDRLLCGSKTRARNGLASEDPYMQGMAQANAEVAHALLDADADPEMITGRSPLDLLTDDDAGSPLSAAALTPMRARQLAGFFVTQAVRCNNAVTGIPITRYDSEQWTAQGRFNAYTQAAVRFTNARCMQPDLITEARLQRLIEEGATDPDAIVTETWDEDC